LPAKKDMYLQFLWKLMSRQSKFWFENSISIAWSYMPAILVSFKNSQKCHSPHKRNLQLDHLSVVKLAWNKQSKDIGDGDESWRTVLFLWITTGNIHWWILQCNAQLSALQWD
jgi:hypothetical protein